MVYIVLCSTGSTPSLVFRDVEESAGHVEVLGLLHDTCHMTCSEGDHCGERR